MEQKSKTGMPIFEQALGKEWTNVSPVVKKHYGLRLKSNDEVKLAGLMSVHYPLAAFLLLAPARLFGGPVLLREDNIPVQVRNSSHPQNKAMHWHRSFKIRNRKMPIFFRSRMEYAGGNEIIEFIGNHSHFSMGIKMSIKQIKGAILYESTGYLLKIGTLHIPIPGHLLLGHASIEEKEIDDEQIAMSFFIKHRLWGKIYSYSGTFKFSSQNTGSKG